MKLVICKNYDEVSQEAANTVARLVKENPKCVLGLPTGSTPLGMYRRLIEMNKNGEIDFSEVTTFNLDEYYPINKNNSQSYHFFMYDNFFNHINIKKENVHILNGEASSPEEECENYERLIENCGGIDLQVLGIGQNGHIGFNEPAEVLKSATHLTSLTQNTIDANSRFFESKDEVPKSALTMGIGSILKARSIIMLASGKEKTKAVAELLKGDITTQNPSTVLNAHGCVTLFTDIAALGK